MKTNCGYWFQTNVCSEICLPYEWIFFEPVLYKDLSCLCLYLFEEMEKAIKNIPFISCKEFWNSNDYLVGRAVTTVCYTKLHSCQHFYVQITWQSLRIAVDSLWDRLRNVNIPIDLNQLKIKNNPLKNINNSNNYLETLDLAESNVARPGYHHCHRPQFRLFQFRHHNYSRCTQKIWHLRNWHREAKLDDLS